MPPPLSARTAWRSPPPCTRESLLVDVSKAARLGVLSLPAMDSDSGLSAFLQGMFSMTQPRNTLSEFL